MNFCILSNIGCTYIQTKANYNKTFEKSNVYDVNFLKILRLYQADLHLLSGD